VGFERMGLSMTLEEVDEWIIQYDSTKDGVIDSDEVRAQALHPAPCARNPTPETRNLNPETPPATLYPKL
jgi:hypothetical protein